MTSSSRPVLALVLAFAALTSVAASADPGQRGQPQRIDRGGLLRIEPLYFGMSAETGGNFYFWAPGEFAHAGLKLVLHDEPVLLAYGRFTAPRRSFDFPVESGVRELQVFAGAQRKDRAVLLRPDGTIVAGGDAGAELQTFSHMLIAKIRNPAPGNWRIAFEGAGMFSVSAHVKPSAEAGAPNLDDFDFVEMGGRPGHEGWFPIQREVFKGQTIACQLEISGAASAVELAFVTGDNRPLATVPIDSQPGDSEHYLGRCLIPGVPFRAVVTGRDQLGRTFRRTISPLYKPR